MSQSDQLLETLESRERRREDRRAFFTAMLGAAAVGGGVFAFANPASAQAVSDADILNFALNLEYLEANFYSFALTGSPLGSADTTGTGTAGAATGGRQVTFTDPVVAAYAREIAANELAHVRFLRAQLATSAIAQPQIDLSATPLSAFSTVARSAGLIGTGQTFDPYANENNFMLAGFMFEDVGVTAYKGSAGLLANKTFLEAAAGILAVEAYHASIFRTTLYRKGIAMPSLINATESLSNARDSLDGGSDIDQGVAPTTVNGQQVSNVAPLDGDGIAFGRTTGQVLNIVYLNRAAVTAGGFFPAGVNGAIKTSAAS